jgi:RNA polymerase sigma factor (sigma-70 family)
MRKAGTPVAQTDVDAFHAWLNARPLNRPRLEGDFRARLERSGLSPLEFLRTLDDATLVDAVVRCCFASEAFQVLLVERNSRERRLTAYFLHHGLDYQDAMDLVQTLYMKLYARGLQLFQKLAPANSRNASAAFDRWLFGGCARNLLLDWFRKRRGLGGPMAGTVGLVSEPASREAWPDGQAMLNEDAERLRNALHQLSELDGALFHDYWEEGTRMEDLARKYNLAVSSVCRRLKAARETVQAALAGRTRV